MMLRAWVRAHAALPAALGVLLSSVVCAATTDQSANVAGVHVRTTWFLMMLGVIFQSLLLNPAFASLEPTLVRARPNRMLQAIVFAALSTLPLSVLVSPTDDRVLMNWYLLLSSVAALASAVLPDRGWLVILVLGGGTILLDHLLFSAPVSQAMLWLPTAAAPTTFMISLIMFTVAPARDCPVNGV